MNKYWIYIRRAHQATDLESQATESSLEAISRTLESKAVGNFAKKQLISYKTLCQDYHVDNDFYPLSCVNVAPKNKYCFHKVKIASSAHSARSGAYTVTGAAARAASA